MAYKKAGIEETGWDSIQVNYRSETDKTDKNDIAVGRECVRVRVFLCSEYRGEQGRQKKKRRSSVLGNSTTKMAAMAASSRRWVVWPRQKLTWASCRRKYN